jgi:hypothetical protein
MITRQPRAVPRLRVGRVEKVSEAMLGRLPRAGLARDDLRLAGLVEGVERAFRADRVQARLTISGVPRFDFQDVRHRRRVIRIELVDAVADFVYLTPRRGADRVATIVRAVRAAAAWDEPTMLGGGDHDRDGVAVSVCAAGFADEDF